ncbi:MAG: hypothetical protein ACJ798_08470 [Phenylobacterium sp.]
MELKPGSRWKSAVCDGEFVVVRPPSGGGVLACGGAPLVPHGAERPAGASLSADHSAGSVLGKRYSDPQSGLTVLCSKPGAGSLSLDGRPLVLQEAKKLPASD